MVSSCDCGGRTKPSVKVSTLLLILGALSAFGPLATDMYLSGFSLLAETFQVEMSLVSLSLSVYFFGLAGGQLLYGPLIDRYGRKPLLLVGIAVFTLASLLIVFAPSIHAFIALRLFQAIGSCAGMIIARAIISDLYDETESARFFSLMGIVIVLAPLIAPTLGGYLTALVGWKSVFVFLAVFGAGCFALTSALLPETLAREDRKKLVLGGILKSYALLLIKKKFMLFVLICAVTSGELFAFITGSPFVYMNLLGVSAEHYGLLLGVNALGMVVGAKINHLLLKRFTPLRILWVCVGLNAFFAMLLVLFAAQASLVLLIALVVSSLMWLPSIWANATALAMSATSELRGSTSAVLGVIQFGFASLSSACVGILHNGTVYPMAGLIAGCSACAVGLLLVDRYVLPPAQTRQPDLSA